MEKRQLGESDLEVSVFGLGTMTFGHESDEVAGRLELMHLVDFNKSLILNLVISFPTPSTSTARSRSSDGCGFTATDRSCSRCC